MAVTIGSNISSLIAQRRLNDTSNNLSRVYERLSSGMRINSAADDAAGLSVASGLRVDARVFSQGVRNISDGVSALSIADGAMEQLSGMIIRQSELATQAANGTFSTRQRLSLQKESDALSAEFNRIIQTTSFNGRNLFNVNDSSIRLQAGYGTDGSIDVSYLSAFTRQVGSGSFTASVTLQNEIARTVFSVDVNGDGHEDILNSNDNGTGNVTLQINNGDGTYAAAVSLGVGNGVIRMAVGDINGDGFVDIASAGVNVAFRLGNGDGTFASAVAAVMPGGYTVMQSIRIADIDNDGRGELITIGDPVGGSASHVNIFKASANGSSLSLNSQLQYQATNFNGTSLEIGDINGDGQMDIVSTDVENRIRLFVGNGNGTFQSARTIGIHSNNQGITLGDVDKDGDLDVVSFGSLGLMVLNNNGDGTFSNSSISVSSGASYLPDAVKLGDINNDGILDVIGASTSDGTTNGSYLNIFYGNGDGSFSAAERSLLRSGTTIRGFDFGDTDGDGIQELIVGSNGTELTIFEPTLESAVTTEYLSLLSAEDARRSLDIARQSLERISKARGLLGANQSRLGIAANNLRVQTENFISAESRIRDTDVAQDSSELTSRRIMQQVGAAVLAQANLQPSLALKLLQN